MIPVKEAMELLGVTSGPFYTSKKFKPYIMGNGMFDYEQYIMDRSSAENIIAKATLFIEYLVHEKKIKYTEIARRSGMPRQNVHSHKISKDAGIKIIRAMSEYVNDFDEYYGYR
jgi:hypothetical protein